MARMMDSRKGTRDGLGLVRPVLLVALAAGLMVVAGWLKWREVTAPLPNDIVPFVAHGRAVATEDGDTLDVEPTGDVAPGSPRRFKVRLHAVDAPELLQADGTAARAALARLIHKQELQLDCYKRDARGRAVCRVALPATAAGGTATDVELELLRQGWAWHYRAFAGEQTADERARYAAAEAEAQSARRGLWRAEAPMPPWECRERLRAARACD